MKVLVTGSAGFIGFHLVEKLLYNNFQVIGVDNINKYYDSSLKYSRLECCGIEKGEIEWYKEVKSSKFPNYKFIRLNIEDKANLMALCAREKIDIIIHLAAQAGVRYSVENPDIYVQSNVVGFLNILEISRYFNVKHLVYASSSSVYGLNEMLPYSTENSTNHPVSLYAATKKSNELMAHTYSHLYNIPTTGLRFFTVYGPWGRPDMAYFLFANAIKHNNPIKVFNNGLLKRDFTYIDDIVDGIITVMRKPAEPSFNWNPKYPNPSISSAPYRLYNIGNNNPESLLDFINIIGMSMNIDPKMIMMDMQQGDVVSTWANIDDIISDFNYLPRTSLKDGISKFVEWYLDYYNFK